jgi:hypothetical protein
MHGSEKGGEVIMEIDVKHTKQRNKRRERAQRMQAERGKDADGVGIDSADEDSKKPIRPPQRRKKANIFKEPSPILEEDVVDGFAILSFKTYEDLEVRIFSSMRQISLYIRIFVCFWNFKTAEKKICFFYCVFALKIYLIPKRN